MVNTYDFDEKNPSQTRDFKGLNLDPSQLDGLMGEFLDFARQKSAPLNTQEAADSNQLKDDIPLLSKCIGLVGVKEVAAYLNVTPRTVYKWSSGYVLPSKERIVQILKKTQDYLRDDLRVLEYEINDCLIKHRGS